MENYTPNSHKSKEESKELVEKKLGGKTWNYVSEIYKKGDSFIASFAPIVFEAAEKFARVEGILPAPESAHAIKVAIDEAMKCKETGEEKTIVFGLTGTGYFDMMSYEKFHNGVMTDYEPTDEEIETALKRLPKLDV